MRAMCILVFRMANTISIGFCAWSHIDTCKFHQSHTKDFPEILKQLLKKAHLVQPACEIDDNFSSSVVVDDLKLSNITCGSKESNHTFMKTWQQVGSRVYPLRSWWCFNSWKSILPCFIMTVRKRTITLEQGLMRTWRFPRFSALLMLFRASARTFMRTMMPANTLKYY